MNKRLTNNEFYKLRRDYVLRIRPKCECCSKNQSTHCSRIDIYSEKFPNEEDFIVLCAECHRLKQKAERKDRPIRR